MLRSVVCPLAHFTLMLRFCVTHRTVVAVLQSRKIKVVGDLRSSDATGWWSGPPVATGTRGSRPVYGRRCCPHRAH